MTRAGEPHPETVAPVDALLAAFGGPERAPASGSAAALVGALAAALVLKCARFTKDGAPAAQAEALSTRLARLAVEDERAYRDALAAIREPPGSSQEQRDFALGRALAVAAEVPAAIAEACADVALLAEELARSGDPELRADAEAAALLAAAASQAATHLVEVNLAARSDDDEVRRAVSAAAAATEVAARIIDST